MINNLDHVQVNLLVFLLCLLGVRASLTGREAAAGGWIAAATAIKVTPVFFAIWAAIRGNRRMLAAVAGFGVLGLILPMLQRGFSQGMIDLRDYYQAFLHQFAAGAVVTNYRNQNLAAMVYRAVVPGSSGDTPPYDYAYLPHWSPGLHCSTGYWLCVILGVFLLHLIRLRITAPARRRTGDRQRLPGEPSPVGNHLEGAPGHSALRLLRLLRTAIAQQMSRASRVALVTAWAGMVLVGLGRDVVGARLHHYLAGYSVFVWVMLLLFGLSVVWSGRSGKKA